MNACFMFWFFKEVWGVLISIFVEWNVGHVVLNWNWNNNDRGFWRNHASFKHIKDQMTKWQGIKWPHDKWTQDNFQSPFQVHRSLDSDYPYDYVCRPMNAEFSCNSFIDRSQKKQLGVCVCVSWYSFTISINRLSIWV